MYKLENSIVLAAGGTGGHVFPAQALAQELSSQGNEVFIFTDDRGQSQADKNCSLQTSPGSSQTKEQGKVRNDNLTRKNASWTKVNTLQIPASRIQGSFGQKFKGGIELIKGFGAAFYHLKRLKPTVVIGFGGYASFPTVIAAIILRVPTIIHQADAFFGRANRFLAPFVTRIATSFPYVERIPTFCRKKVNFTGLPVRPDIQPAPYIPSEEKAPFHLLVTGGSQGTRVFGDIIPQAISLLDSSMQSRLHITQQCRPEFLDITQTLYKKTKAHVELSPFLDRMGERYKASHLIISRAGASSVVEAAHVGRPVIFVPYPYALDDHQYYNAQQVVGVGGGWMLREKEFTSKSLAILLSDLIISPWKLTQAAVNIRTIANLDASLRLAHLVKLLEM